MSMAIDPQTLAQIPLFKDLTPAELATITGLFHRETFPADAVLIAAAQPGELAYIIEDGSVKICVHGGAGRHVIVALLGVGEVLGEMSLVDGMGRSATVVTQEPSTLLAIDRASFWQYLWELEPVHYNLMLILSRRLRLLTTHVQVLSAPDIKERVARQLLSFAQEYGQASDKGGTLIAFRLTEADLACMIGASREQVSQILEAWKLDQHLAVGEDSRLTILDAAALGKYCS